MKRAGRMVCSVAVDGAPQKGLEIGGSLLANYDGWLRNRWQWKLPSQLYLTSGFFRNAGLLRKDYFHPVHYTDFETRWLKSGGAERANYGLFLQDFCDLLGVPRPAPTRPPTTPRRTPTCWSGP